MDEFTAIAEDLSTWEHQHPAFTPAELSGADEKISPAILSRINSDLKPIAVLVCVMTSAANALELETAGDSIGKLIVDFCPSEASRVAISADGLANCPYGVLLSERVQDYNARLEFARMLTKHLDGKLASNASLSTGDKEILADAWRRTCGSILSLIAAIESGDGRSNASDGNDVLISGFLKNCVRGGSPCLNDAGELQIPGWAERRNEVRVALEQPAQASTGGEYFDVAVLNASKVGLGIAGEAKNGEHTTVVFPDGRSISGTVMWSEDGRFGLQLDQPLSKTDKLLTGTAKHH